jgi:hypothetical protein
MSYFLDDCHGRPIVEETARSMAGGDLGESEEEWKREFTTLAKQARRRVVGRFR